MDSNYDKNPEGSKPSGFFASTRIKRARTPSVSELHLSSWLTFYETLILLEYLYGLKILLFEVFRHHFCGLRLAASSTNIFSRGIITADKCVANRCSCAKLNRNSYTNILRNCKNAGAISFSFASNFSGDHHRRTTTFRKSCPCFCKRIDSYRHTNRSRLISDSRTSLIL